MIKALLFILAVLPGSYTYSQSSQFGKQNFDSIVADLGKEIQKDVEEDSIGGSISVAIVHEDKIIWSKAFGYADKGNNVMADTSTIYRIGSISKSFTAFLMMQLVEKGLLKLSDPVELYLPEIKQLKGYDNAARITFYELATHTSGIAREPQLPGAGTGSFEDWDKKVLAAIPATSIKTRPGKKFSYSNIGYAILGLALSRAAGKPYTTLVEENIFIPLGMNNSYFVVPNTEKAKLAAGMNGGPWGRIDLKTPKREHLGRGYKVPNGGIYSTPNDLLKFVMANIGLHPLLDTENLALMQKGSIREFTPSTLIALKSISVFMRKPNRQKLRYALHSKYGIGFVIHEFKEIVIVEHSGSVAGYTAQLAFDKKSKYGVVLMRNYNSGRTDLNTCSYLLLKKLKGLNG